MPDIVSTCEAIYVVIKCQMKESQIKLYLNTLYF